MRSLGYYFAIFVGVFIIITAIITKGSIYQYMFGVYQIMISIISMHWDKETDKLNKEIGILKEKLKEIE